MVLNWKIAEHYKEGGTDKDNEIATLYNELYLKADEYAVNNLKDEQLKYFYDTTD